MKNILIVCSLLFVFACDKRNEANTAFVTTDGKPLMPDGSNAVPVYLKNSQSTILPSIGLIIEF